MWDALRRQSRLNEIATNIRSTEAEDLRLDDELLAPDRARRIQTAEQQIAHADTALAEPAQRVLIEARVPVLRREVAAYATAELRGDPIGRLAERRERLPPRVSRTREHRVDRCAEESAVAAGCGEDLDLSGVGPAPQRVGVDAEDAACLPQRQPVTVLERRLGDTVNLGELPANVER